MLVKYFKIFFYSSVNYVLIYECKLVFTETTNCNKKASTFDFFEPKFNNNMFAFNIAKRWRITNFVKL